MTYPAETYEKTFTGQEPFIAQHRSAGIGLLPAAVQLEMAMVGVARRRPFSPLELTDVTFLRPLTIADDAAAPVRLDVAFGPQTRFELSTVVAGDRKPLSTGTGRLLPDAVPATSAGTGRQMTGTRTITSERLYDSWAREGLQYGPDFRTVRELAVGDGGVARATLRSDAEPVPWYAHPLLVDGVFQVVSCALQDLTGEAGPYPMLPIGVARVAVLADLSGLSTGVTVLVRRTSVDGAYATADALLLGPSDEVVAEFEGLRMRRTAAVSGPVVAAAPARAAALPITRIDWRPASTTDERHEPATGTWVVLHNGGTGSLGERAARQLRAEGARVVEVGVGPSGAEAQAQAQTQAHAQAQTQVHAEAQTQAQTRASAHDRDRRTLAQPDEDAFRRLWEEVGDPVAGVVHLWNTGDGPDGAPGEETELRLGLYGCLAALRTLGERQRKSRFFVVTQDGQPVADDDRPVPARAALWGFVRTAAIEYPGFHPRLLDIDGLSEDALRAVLVELGAGDGPTEVGYRQGARHVPVRVRDRSAYAVAVGEKGPIRKGGRYLVLGGHGGLGLEVADRFAREGAGAVALVSRSGAAGTDHDRTAAIGAHGCEVASYSADVTTPGALAAVVERFRAEFGELHGVVHAAGTLKDGLIRSATAEDIAAVMRPKVDGVRELAAAVAGLDLDFAVLFASVSGTFGNLGQGGYAAANAYLDAFAQAHGSPWLSVAWGLWGEVGMGTAVAEQLRRRGVRPLDTAEGLDSLIAVLGAAEDPRQVVVAHPDAGDVVVELEDGGVELGAASDVGTDARDVVQEAEVPAGEGAGQRVGDALERFLAERLGVTSFDRDTPLSDYGMSSIMSVELSEELSRRWGIHLPATLFLEYGEFAELVEALTGRYGAAAAVAAPEHAETVASEETAGSADTAGSAQSVASQDTAGSAQSVASQATARSAESVESEGTAQPGGAAQPAAATDTADPLPAASPANPGRRRYSAAGRDGDVAIVAVSGDLPGAVGGAAELWPLLRSGGHAFTEVPAERWDIDAHFEPRGPRMTGTYCRTGAFVSGIDRFEPAFFGISVREAEDMDVQQKLLLEHAWAVRDDSGLAGRRDIGVFVGATYTHHRDAQGLETVGPHTALGSMNAVLANRISYALDLTGPSQTVDTLCSSSLVAVQQAVAALRAGHCGAAIVAACQVGLTPWYYRSLSQLGALSETRPRPFDERADGFLPGEGALAVMLKPLADAERDGDRIWGVVRGTAVNHGGRGSALPVPRSEAQAAVVRAALDDAGLAPADVSLIETHGTATRLGDPIEIAALTEVFGGDPDRDEPCHIGTVKGNIGHLEPAAGLAGLLKVLLCLRHREIPPVAGFETPSSHLDLSAGPFVIPVEPRPWTSDGPRRAGVSSFGMGGTNAHIVVEEYVGEIGYEASGEGTRTAAAGPDEHLLVLSAHTSDALVRRMADVRPLLRQGDAASLGALCRSTAVGRDHRAYRVAVLGATADELTAGLAEALRLADRAPGTVVRGGTVLENASTGLGVAAFRYVGGGTVDWAGVYPGPSARRPALPPYPFGSRPESAGPAATSPRKDVSAVQVIGDTADVARRLSRAHRVLGEETVPGALPVALGLLTRGALRQITFTGRGTGDHPLTSDLDDPARTGPATFRHADRVIARLTTAEAPAGPPPAAADLDALRAVLDRTLEPAGLYAWFAAKGMELTAPLRSITEVHHGPGRVLARIGVPAGGGPLEAEAVALDAALQAMAVLTLADPAAPSATYLPVSIGRAVRWADAAQAAFVLLEGAEPDSDGTRRGDASLLSADGRVLVRLDDVEYRTVAGNGVPRPAPTHRAPQTAAAEAAVVEVVRNALHDPGVTATTSLSTVGLDSMLATVIAADVEAAYGVKLGPTDVLDAADCRALAAHVAELAGDGVFAPSEADERRVAEPDASDGDRPTAAATARDTASDDTTVDQDIAVIGLALALPGAADPEAFWSLLADSGEEIRPAPAHRWGRYAEGNEPDVGGFLDNVEEFDARFFDFFPKQAEVLDPQARWLLRTTWEALESAGLPPRRLPSSTGVFVGASYQHYKDYNIAPELDAPSGLGNHNAFLANRVSFFLDLHGPSMTIDTLCSSSLVALHTAVRSLRDGECEQAIVAGVRVALSPLHYVAMKNLRALSPSGASRPFDAGADGFVPGEGVVTVVVKPLGAALRDGDRVRGVIRGSAVNHGGRTSGLTVPSSAAQQEVIAAALGDAGVSVESIGLVEAHGTGTSLGDPIEVEGLSRAWRGFSDRSQFCALGSLKGNVGHLEPAAGLAGLVKVLLAMECGVVPPSLHVVRPNDHIRFEETPFYLADRPMAWPRGVEPRRAAVSAFGMGGVNAHVIVEEAPAVSVRGVSAQDSHVVRVSAADETALRTLAGTYAERFEAAHDGWETADLCHTANTARSPLEFQTAVYGRTAAELAAQLRSVAAGSVPVARVDIDLTAEEAASRTGANAAAPLPADVVELVRAGYAHIDWTSLSAEGARVTNLPTYPFAQGSYWHTTDPAPEPGPVPAGDGEAVRIEWRVREPAPAPAAGPATVRLVAADPEIGQALTTALRDRGVTVVGPGRQADTTIVIDAPGSRHGQGGGRTFDLSAFWAELGGVMQALPAHGQLLWAGFHGAAVHPDERGGTSPERAAMAMAVRAAGAESRKPTAVVHLDPADAADVQAVRLAAEFAALSAGPAAGADAGTVVAAYRRGVRYTPEQVSAPASPPYALPASGYYLVTGGLGAVGLRLTERLIDRGAKRIGIIGRSVVDAERSAPLRELARRAEVEYLACDVSDPAALAAAAGQFGRRWGRLVGVVHSSGGVNPFGAMHRRTWSDAEKVLAPKVPGSLNVVRLAKEQGADFAVLVSSIAGTQALAGRGLVDYSLANAYQLALAERENDSVTTVTAHAWPNWTGIGMKADASFSAAHSVGAEQALDAFFDHLRSGGAVIFPGSAPSTPPEAAESVESVEPAPPAAPVEPRVLPAPAPAGQDVAGMRARVRDAFVQVLGEDPGDRPLQRLGLDSLVIAELTTALEQRSGLTVDPSLLMRARTAVEIAADLAVQEAPASHRPTTTDQADAPASALSALLRPLLDHDRQRGRGQA
ncbi:SDR family NAD(P)-dependent oxidoreductase [Streptomyces sp. NPDC056527]|uniref:SDR family NAD(P)-dependent oxidoreductase n=1 Tax=Streptomyces sp. NPDC056527 TaxID=3345853 RepID=UPI003698F788